MPSGIQCWDDSGNVTLDLTTPLLKVLGQASVGYSYTGSTSSGTITDSRFTAYAGHVPFWFALGGIIIDFDNNTCQFSIAGNVLTWSFPNAYSGAATRPDTTFIYGIMESA